MSSDPEGLDLSMLPPEHREAFKAMQRRVDALAEENKRQEALIHCPAVHSKGMSREGRSCATRCTAGNPRS